MSNARREVPVGFYLQPKPDHAGVLPAIEVVSPERGPLWREVVYVAGPMRGRAEHNYPAFDAAAERFKALGASVVNPADLSREWDRMNPGRTFPPTTYLRRDLRRVLGGWGESGATALALLPGWEASTGARCEVAVAVTLGLKFFDAATGEQTPPPARVTVSGGYECAPGVVAAPTAEIDRLRAELGLAKKSIAWAAGKLDRLYDYVAKRSADANIGKALAGLPEALHVADVGCERALAEAGVRAPAAPAAAEVASA